MFPERQYLHLIRNIVKNGNVKNGRNGITRSINGYMMRFPLDNNTLPLMTTKKLAWQVCLKELLWFIKGDTSNKSLKKQNVKIWNGNATRNFLDSRGLFHLEEDDLGPVYGHQWRHYNAKYKNSDTDYSGKGIDQLQNVIDILKNPKERDSRRIIMTSWNPEQIDEMALPPCHVLTQFHVNDGKLSCSLYQRSGDVGLGIPFNIASYSFLTHILATHCSLEAGEFIHHIGDAHIYEQHIGALLKQLKNEVYEFPKLNISKKHENITDYCLKDFQVVDYKSHDPIFMEMIA